MQKQIWLLSILSTIIVILVGILIFVPAKPKQEPIKTGIVINSVERIDSNFADITVKGYVNGDGWSAFEGQAGVVNFLDKDNKSLGFSSLKVIGEWTVPPPLNFTSTMRMTPAEANSVASLEFKNENPSGDPTRDRKFILPVKLKASSETTAVKAYFAKSETTGSTCSVVFPIDRVVPKTQAVAKAALEELLKGPTTAEKAQGYFTSIPAGSKLNSVSIVDGVASADFDQTTQSGGGSCSMAERMSEITFTLKQFSNVKSVKLSINGQTEGIFQP